MHYHAPSLNLTSHSKFSTKSNFTRSDISRVRSLFLSRRNYLLFFANQLRNLPGPPQRSGSIPFEGGGGGGGNKTSGQTGDKWRSNLLSLKIRRAYRQVTNDKRMQSECGKQILSSVNVATGHQRKISRVNGPT